MHAVQHSIIQHIQQDKLAEMHLKKPKVHGPNIYKDTKP
jgi:hypothetical protein